MPDLTVSTLSMAKWEGAGISIDAHPGSEGNEAGVVNRALRAAARVLIGAVGTQEDDLAAVVTWALCRAALRQLADLGVEGGVVDRLLVIGPGLGDRWSAYLALAPAVVINDLMRFASESGC